MAQSKFVLQKIVKLTNPIAVASLAKHYFLRLIHLDVDLPFSIGEYYQAK